MSKRKAKDDPSIVDNACVSANHYSRRGTNFILDGGYVIAAKDMPVVITNCVHWIIGNKHYDCYLKVLLSMLIQSNSDGMVFQARRFELFQAMIKVDNEEFNVALRTTLPYLVAHLCHCFLNQEITRDHELTEDMDKIRLKISNITGASYDDIEGYGLDNLEAVARVFHEETEKYIGPCHGECGGCTANFVEVLSAQCTHCKRPVIATETGKQADVKSFSSSDGLHICVRESNMRARNQYDGLDMVHGHCYIFPSRVAM